MTTAKKKPAVRKKPAAQKPAVPKVNPYVHDCKTGRNWRKEHFCQACAWMREQEL